MFHDTVFTKFTAVPWVSPCADKAWTSAPDKESRQPAPQPHTPASARAQVGCRRGRPEPDQAKEDQNQASERTGPTPCDPKLEALAGVLRRRRYLLAYRLLTRVLLTVIVWFERVIRPSKD